MKNIRKFIQEFRYWSLVKSIFLGFAFYNSVLLLGKNAFIFLYLWILVDMFFSRKSKDRTFPLGCSVITWTFSTAIVFIAVNYGYAFIHLFSGSVICYLGSCLGGR